tara:strand:+ start:1508 stop:2683 length:1176 start_codon:yes stop_codon:yes gene_type:complete
MKNSKKIKSNFPDRKYQICKRCVMDTSDKLIQFDSNGICNHCRDYLDKRLSVTAYKKQDKYALEHLFERVRMLRSPNSKYDAAIGISGGTDSSMVAYLASKAGLKVLAIHMDNCWDSPIAAKNIKNLISLPGIDYYCKPLIWNKFKKIQRAFLESGLPDIDLPTDSAIISTVYRVANLFNIKVLLSGGNIANEGILPSSWMYNPKDSLFVNSVLKKAGLHPEIMSDIKYGLKLDIKYRFFDTIKTFYPLNKFKYDKRNARKILEKEINWESPIRKHAESIYTEFNQFIYMPIKHNADYRRAHLSQDIILNRISRKEALNILENSAYSHIDTDYYIAFVAQKLGYSVKELKIIINKPPLWYVDFPNREKLLNTIYNLFRLVTKRKLSSTWWG